MFKRVTIVALVVAAFVLVMAVPAMAFNGLRGDYTTSNACAVCRSGSPRHLIRLPQPGPRRGMPRAP